MQASCFLFFKIPTKIKIFPEKFLPLRDKTHIYAETAQHCDHRPRRSRQDDARRQDDPGRTHPARQLETDRRVDSGQQRPGARTGHHDPLEERFSHLQGLQDQHHRYAGPRRLRRRGRARAEHVRRRAAAGRCLRGHDAADALRAAEGPGAGQETHRRGEQGGQAQLPPGGSERAGLRPDVLAQRHRGAARLQDHLRIGQARLDVAQVERADRLDRPAARRHHRRDSRAGHRRGHAAAAHHLARILGLHGPHRRGQAHARHAACRTERHAGQARWRDDAEVQDQGADGLRGAGQEEGRGGSLRRDLRRDGSRGIRDRRHDLRLRESRTAAPHRHRRTDDVDALHDQQLALLRQGRQIRHLAPHQGASGPRAGEEPRAARDARSVGRLVQRLRPRRAAPLGAHRDDAPRRLRTAGGAAPRDRQGDRRSIAPRSARAR